MGRTLAEKNVKLRIEMIVVKSQDVDAAFYLEKFAKGNVNVKVPGISNN